MDERTAEVFSPSPYLPHPTSTAPLEGDPYLAHDVLELSPPFLKDAATAIAQTDALPYHWLELSHLLLTHAADDFEDPDTVRRLLRDLREVRMSKLRKGFRILDAGAGVKMNGVGGMEIAEVRGFVGGVVDGLRYVYRRAFCVNLCCKYIWPLTLITGSLTAPVRSHEESAKQKTVRTGWEVVATVTMRMMTCYNAAFASYFTAVSICLPCSFRLYARGVASRDPSHDTVATLTSLHFHLQTPTPKPSPTIITVTIHHYQLILSTLSASHVRLYLVTPSARHYTHQHHQTVNLHKFANDACSPRLWPNILRHRRREPPLRQDLRRAQTPS